MHSTRNRPTPIASLIAGFALSAALLATVAGPAVTAAATPTPVAAETVAKVTKTGGNRSGLTWKSGAFVPTASPHDYAKFGVWRGHKLDVAVMWPARGSWNDIVNPGWMYQTWASMPVTKVLGVAMLPENVKSATMSKCAAGAYDAKWREFGRNIHRSGMDRSTIVRLGWEFNGDWFKWSARDPKQFASCWRHEVSSAEQTAPALRWDWNVNRGQGQSVKDARKAWPGDKYVDIVGVDSYDMWPAATTSRNWNGQVNGKYGLNFWLRFAKAHGKKLSVPEWGVYPGRAAHRVSGGDNPYFVSKMVGYFRANAGNLAYESYFNESASYYKGSLYGPTQAPKAARAYKQAL